MGFHEVCPKRSRTSHPTLKHNRTRMLALFAVIVSLAVLFAPMVSNGDSDATDPDYMYTINTKGEIISDFYTAIGSSSTGAYTSSNGSNVGSWGFDSNGYGPFNSFYAAFNPLENNRMVCHLDPNDLTKSMSGESIAGEQYNIMWCLPTVYWFTDSTGNLILSNNPSKGVAYAHTINGKVYNYIGIGVYEASTISDGSTTILTSTSGDTPLTLANRATFRDYANNQKVNTDGGSVNNGYAMVWNFYQWELYKYCALAVMGSWDSQSIAGNGSSYGEDPYYDMPGLLDKAGPYAGTRGDSSNKTYTQDPVKVFIENAWGGLEEFVDGVIIKNKGLVVDSKSVPTDATAAGTNVVVYSSILPGSNGYGSNPSTSAGVWGMPTATNGSQYAGLYDNVYSSTGGNYVLLVGGYSENVYLSAPLSGLSYIDAAKSQSISSWYMGGRLAFVFDADPKATQTATLDHTSLIAAGGNATGLTVALAIMDATTTYPDLGTTSDGYTHTGWMVDGTFYEKTSTVATTGSHTAYSVWKAPSITITFYVEGEIYSTLEVPKGSVGVVYTPVMVEGIFAGWYYDASFTQKYDATRALNADTALYALGVPSLIFTTEPNANATITPLYGGMFFFDATESSGRYQIEWDFGDGNTSNDPIAYNTYSDPGLYTVTLTVTNIYGESSTTTYELDLRDGSAANDIKWFTIGALCVIVVGLVVRRLI